MIADNGDSGIDNTEVFCTKMLRHGLELDQVHLFKDFSVSQIEEKFTWVIEKIRTSLFKSKSAQKPIILVAIVNIGDGLNSWGEGEEGEERNR